MRLLFRPLARRKMPLLSALPLWLGLAALGLTGCAPLPEATARAPANALILPLAEPKPLPATPAPGARLPPNSQLAQDFLELNFALETGRELPRFTRFEGPISVSMAGRMPQTARTDLAQLLTRLRNEAGVPISTAPGAANRIQIEFLPKRQMQARVPNAACFVVPGVAGWADYLRHRNGPRTDWAGLQTRQLVSVFIPSDASPQEVRDCLHEEISQGLGPLNDLYRLPDTVWNDDNFHAVLTRYDMLMLRLAYAPEMRSGMTRPEVMARLPGLLARLNPGGGAAMGAAPPAPTPQAYVEAITGALGGARSTPQRQASAQRALMIAQAQGWADSRTAFAWFVIGRLSLQADPPAALAAFDRAEALYRPLPGAGIQIAHIDMQRAAHALGTGQPEQATRLVDRALGPARAGQNAALMTTLYMIRAEAQARLGNAAAARQARLDMGRWARYGFGSDAAILSRVTDVAALAEAGARIH
ncbi:MAG: DUF2927 domain-containing protein [Paracoccaceae bacterium]